MVNRLLGAGEGGTSLPCPWRPARPCLSLRHATSLLGPTPLPLPAHKVRPFSPELFIHIPADAVNRRALHGTHPSPPYSGSPSRNVEMQGVG